MATPIIIDCDPGHDDAIALMLAVASPELELVGVTTVAGNQTLEKTTANALRVLELCGRGRRAGRRGRRATRSSAGARSRRTCTARAGSTAPICRRRRRAVDEHAVELPGRADPRADGELTLVPIGPADEHRAAARARARRTARADRADGRVGRRGKPHAGSRVQHLGRPRGRAARVRERDRRDDDRPRRHAPGS